MLTPATDPIAAAIAAALAEPNPFADTFTRIHKIASGRAENDQCDASKVSLIEGIAERIQASTRDPLATAVLRLCNTRDCPVDQLAMIAAVSSGAAERAVV